MPAPSLADATAVVTNNGLRTQYGLILPPGARVAAYVRSTGVQSGDDAFLAQNLCTTLAQGLARVRPGMGDFVVCLPGHVENVTDATTFSAALVAGTKIIGVGRGSNMPTFTWTNAAGQWSVGVADVMIAGLHLQCAGTVATPTNTTLAINVTANDFGFYYNDVETGTGSSNAVTVMSVPGTAARYDISGNTFRGVVSAGANTTIAVSSTGADGRICDNEIVAGATSATGNINVTAAAPRLKILRNFINNLTAASVAAIALGNFAISGQCAYNTITVLSTGASVSGTTGITIGAAVTMGFFQNFIVNDPLTSGKLLPTVDT